MTDKEILIGAVYDAYQKGYDNFEVPDYLTEEKSTVDNNIIWDGNNYGLQDSVRDIVFSHNFAKAFFGFKDEREHTCRYVSGDGSFLEDWQYHLQQMVLEENPLRYLEKFLTKEN